MFITTKVPVHFHNYTYDTEQYDYVDEASSRAEVRWDEDFDYSRIGIKDIGVYLHTVKVKQVLVDFDNEPHDNIIDYAKHQYAVQPKIIPADYLIPTLVEVDEKRKTVQVIFNREASS